MLIKTSSFPVNNQTEKIEIATFFKNYSTLQLQLLAGIKVHFPYM